MNMNVNQYQIGSFEQDLDLAIKRSLGIDETQKRDPLEQKRSDKKKENEPTAEKQETPAQALTLVEMMLAKHQFVPATQEQINKEIAEFEAAQKQKEEKVAEKQNISSEASEPVLKRPEPIDLTQEETAQVATQATDALVQPEPQEKKE